MWIMTNRGMLSLVQHNQRPEILLVRARDEGTLRDLFPDHEPIELPDADYRFRIEVQQSEMARMAAWLVQGIDYGNFKNSVDDGPLHDAYLQVWHVMNRYQTGRYGPRWRDHYNYGLFSEMDDDQHDPLEDTQPLLPPWAST